jgi:O-antigen ligase
VVGERLSTLARPANPLDDRPAIYREAGRQIRDDPWTGQGPGNFPVASARAVSQARTVGAYHAHNVLLTVASETGIPAAILLVALTLMLGRTVVRASRNLADPRDRALIAGVGSGLFVHVGHGLFDFNLRQAVVLFVTASLVGVVLVARRVLEEQGGGIDSVGYERPVFEPSGRWPSSAAAVRRIRLRPADMRSRRS